MNVLSLLRTLAIGTPVLVQFDSSAFIPATYQGLQQDVAVFRVGTVILRVKATQVNAIVTI